MGGLTKEYVIKRLLMFLLTVWLGTTLIFIIPRLAPGDPVQAMIGRLVNEGANVENADQMIASYRERFGLDEPIHIQYLKYLYNAITFNNGYSLAFFPSQVDVMISRAIPWTVGLLMIALVFSFIIGNTVGALLAWRRTPRTLRMILPISLVFTSIPAYMVGIMLLFLFAITLDWLPFAGNYGRGLDPGLNLPFIGSVIQHGLLPGLSIVLVSMGAWALGMRGMMITTEGEDYMILADAKGLSPSRIFWRYGVRNAILPQITAFGVAIGGLAGGAVLVEVIFTYPGMGSLLYTGILNSDFTLIQGIVFYVIVGVSLAVLILDLTYPLIDPRITYQRS
ncbi:MAG TPA: ABC transporter permease [Anaerolineae bacterium]|nr:ABC transporter permease [Anaerolineae bacterium]